MARRTKHLSCNPDNMKSTPRTHRQWKESITQYCPLTFPHTMASCVHVHVTYINTLPD